MHGCARAIPSRSLHKKNESTTMTAQLIHMLASIAALMAGAFIGVAFGMVQDAARRHNEKRQQTGELKSGWAVMPGSGVRVAYLLIALVLIQFICPLLF